MPAEQLIVSTPTLAEVLGLSPRRIQQLASEGVLKSEKHGTWNVAVNVQAYHRHHVAQEVARASQRAGGANERHVAAKAREVELRTARSEHTLIETAEALAVVDEILGTAKAGFSALPARITRDIALRGKIEAEVDAVWDRLAAQNARRAAELRQHGGAAAPAEPDEHVAEPVPAEPTKHMRRAAQ